MKTARKIHKMRKVKVQKLGRLKRFLSNLKVCFKKANWERREKREEMRKRKGKNRGRI